MANDQKDTLVEVRVSHPFHDEAVEWMGHSAFEDGLDLKNLGAPLAPISL